MQKFIDFHDTLAKLDMSVFFIEFPNIHAKPDKELQNSLNFDTHMKTKLARKTDYAKQERYHRCTVKKIETEDIKRNLS